MRNSRLRSLHVHCVRSAYSSSESKDSAAANKRKEAPESGDERPAKIARVEGLDSATDSKSNAAVDKTVEFEPKELADLTLRVGNTLFVVNKAIVGSKSELFRTLVRCEVKGVLDLTGACVICIRPVSRACHPQTSSTTRRTRCTRS